jgi:hypothetical protein
MNPSSSRVSCGSIPKTGISQRLDLEENVVRPWWQNRRFMEPFIRILNDVCKRQGLGEQLRVSHANRFKNHQRSLFGEPVRQQECTTGYTIEEEDTRCKPGV